MKKKQNQITFGFCDVNTGQRVYPALTDLPDKLPPAQQLYASADDEMYAAITCSPPIGQPTTVARDQNAVKSSSINIQSSYTESSLGRLLCLVRSICFVIRYISPILCL